MQLVELQHKLDTYAKRDPALLASLGLKDIGSVGVEEWRHSRGGYFESRTGVRFKKHPNSSLWLHEVTSEWERSQNIVTNQGLAYVVDVAFREVADIAPWYIALFTNDYTPVAGDAYASNGWTEATGTNLDETVRQAWVDGSPSGTTTRSVDNSAAPVVYTGDNSFTAYGAIVTGGGSTPTTLADEAGGGSAYCASRFATSKAMTVDDTIEVTYTLTAADDGV